MTAVLVQHSVQGNITEGILTASELGENNKVGWRYTDKAKKQYNTDLNIPLQCQLVFLEKFFEVCSATWKVGNNFKLCLWRKEPMGNLN
jgi:hypothetical protein